MFNKFAAVLHQAVEALAPTLSLQEDFVYHWKAVTHYFIDNKDDSIPVEETNIPSHIDQMLDILTQEEANNDSDQTGPCMEYLLQHKILETLHALGKADCPCGMKQVVLSFFANLLGKVKQPLLPHVNVHRPVHRLIKVCGEVRAGPTEKEEIQFLCMVCAKLKADPYLVNFFLEAPKSSSEFYQNNVQSKKNAPASSYKKIAAEMGQPEFNLIHSLLNILQSPDTRVSVKACEGLMLVTSLQEPNAAKCIIEHTQLCEQLSERLCTLYNQLPIVMDPVDVDTVDVTWGLDLYSEDEDDCAFPGKRALISLLSWFDYCDELIKNAHPLIGKLLAKEIKERFYVPVLEPLLLQASEVGILTCTALLIKLVKMTTSESLLSVTVYFLLGDATAKETPGEASHKLRHRFIERCDHLSDEISILSLKLFEVLLLKPHEHIINNLVLRNLAPRTYHASSELLATEEYFESDIDTTEDDVSERTDSPMFDDSDLPPLELEAFDDPVLADDFPVEIPDQLFDVEKMENQILEKLAVENQILNNDFEDKGEHKEEEQTVVEVVNHDNFAEEVAAVEKATKLSPRSQTSSNAASSIASGSIVMDVTSNASGSVLVEERPGIHAVVNSYLSLVPEYAKSSSAGDSGYDTYLRDAHRQFRECSVQCLRWEWPTYPKPVDKIDYSHAFYEGVFLKVLFDKLSQLLDQPYEVNLQLTSVMAKLAQFPHPHTHEFMLDPYLRLEPGCRSLYTVLCRLVSDLKSRVKAMPHFQIQCIQVRKQLTEMTEEESSSYIELMEGVIVLEEFCKELAAIAFVKAHAESGRI